MSNTVTMSQPRTAAHQLPHMHHVGGLVPFVLATPHHAATEVVAQIDQAIVSAASGQSTEQAVVSRLCAPKVPPLA